MIQQMFLNTQHLKKLYYGMVNKVGKKFDLSQNECDVLIFLKINPHLNTAKDITNCRGIAKSNISIAIESLRKKGYLDVITDSENRKINRLLVSDKSKTIMNELGKCQEKCLEVITSNLSKEEQEFLKKLLQNIDVNVTKALKDMEE